MAYVPRLSKATTSFCNCIIFLTLFVPFPAHGTVSANEENGNAKSPKECPTGCTCTIEAPTTLSCVGLDLEGIPAEWPNHFERLLIRNWTMSTVEKQAFRRFQQLRELQILDCPQLDLIDRNAFKQLRKLRSLTIRGNKNLRELYKASFTGIGNEHALSIQIANNALERIRAFAFKNAQNLRELLIEDRCFELEAGALAGINRLDFLTLKGICALEAETFQNTSRLHQLQIQDSSLSQLPRNCFAQLSHVNQIQIRECRIGRVEEGALAGLFTVGSVHIQSNQIGRLAPEWAKGTENLGSLVFSYNTVREPLVSPDCLVHDAQRFLFTENTLQCSCTLQWMVNFPPEEQWLTENYCGREEAFKALLYFSPAAAGCPPWHPPPKTTAQPAPRGLAQKGKSATGDMGQSPPMHAARSWESGELEHSKGAAGEWGNSAGADNEQLEGQQAHHRRHSAKKDSTGMANGAAHGTMPMPIMGIARSAIVAALAGTALFWL